MFQKFATATIIEAKIAQPGGGLIRTSHRAVFNYTPRPGFLYARSRMISSRCNDNHDEFPASEIRAAWKTAIGKPVFVNHHNEDHKRMRGVIIDAVLHEDTLPDGRPDVWIEALHEIDAQRFPKLAKAILEGRVNRTSMGTDVGFSVCSACGNKASTPAEYCQHIPQMKGKILYRHTASGQREGHLIREICYKLGFFENSFLVEDPADPTAVVTGVDDRGLKATASRTASALPKVADYHVTCDRPGCGMHWGPHGAAGLLIRHRDPEDGQTRYLLQKRAPWVDHGDTWGIPGGALHEDESPEEGAEREAEEEMGELPGNLRHHKTHTDDHGGWAYHTVVLDSPERFHPGGGGDHSYGDDDDDYHDDDDWGYGDGEASGHGWFTKAEMKNMDLHPSFAQSLKKVTSAMRKGAPFAGYEDFDECTEKNAEKEDPDAYCGEIKKRTEGSLQSSLPSIEIEAVRYDKPTDHPFFKDVPLHPKHIIATYDEADAPTRAQGMRWYSDGHAVAKALDPDGDAHRGAGVLAAYSPRSNWPINLFNASRSLQQRRAVRIGEGMNVMGSHAKSAAKILEEGQHYFKAFTTPKITDFAHLLAHGGDDENCPTCEPHRKPDYPKQAVVVDRHALSAAAGRRMNDNDLGRAPLGTRKFYEHVADQYREAAKHISERDGVTIHPHQLQAVTWLQQQKRNAAQESEQAASDPKAKGRLTRERNAWTKWEEHSRQHHPEFHTGDEEANMHLRNPHAGMRSSLNSLASLLVMAYGEVKAPQDVDTLRTESCPVCGETDAFDGNRCQVCNFIQPPAMFTDPDTGVARQMDLRKDVMDQQQQIGPDGQPIPGQEGVDPNDPNGQNQPMEGLPGQAGDQIADLFCPACGFSADTQEPMTNNDPSMPSEQQGLQEGDVCPNCGQATMLSPNDVGAMGGEVPQEIADDADADGMPDDQEPDVDEDGIPDDQEPDEDQDGRPDDSEDDEDQDEVPDDADPDDDGDGEADAVEDQDEAPKGRKDNARRV